MCAGLRPEVSGSDNAEIRPLKKEVTEIGVLTRFCEQRQLFCSRARPTRVEAIRYGDLYRDQFEVELFCRVLGNSAGGLMASRGYRVRIMYFLMRRQGWLVGRDQAARVMKTPGITGVKRGKQRSKPG